MKINRIHNGQKEMSDNQITREYLKMLKHPMIAGEHDGNKYNTYTCENGHRTNTYDIDKGVTPYLIKCPKCDEMARSSFYRVGPFTTEEIDFNWIRPSLEETFNIKYQESIDHVLNGGLIRKETKK